MVEIPEQAKGNFIAVMDFGAQYAKLIARRVRDENVYSVIVPSDITAAELEELDPSGIILSGGPSSVHAEGAPDMDEGIFDLSIPVLGICYGMQLMAKKLGGEVAKNDVSEYGPTTLNRLGTSVLLDRTPMVKQKVWMSHRDAVVKAPDEFMVSSETESCPVATMELPYRRLFGTQFHPEVMHTEYGQHMLKIFLFDICRCEPTWTVDSFIDTTIEKLQAEVGDKKVILAYSGGVDSTVCAALLDRALGDQVTCIFVDTGLLRKGEGEQVQYLFAENFNDVELVYVHAEERFLNALAGVTDPEEKRRIVGSEFWKVFFEEAQKIGDVTFMAQGTIYPDIVESGSRKTGDNTSTIKSHHNLVPFPEGVHFDVIEPLDELFKDEVRRLGDILGLPESVVWRQPFPGPGLSIRIMSDVTEERLTLLRDADEIVREEIDIYNAKLFAETGDHNSAHACWQYFAILPCVESTGVKGDERSFEQVIVVRAVESADAMTADWAHLPLDVLDTLSHRLVDEVPGINRVVYDITPKPPATIEWE